MPNRNIPRVKITKELLETLSTRYDNSASIGEALGISSSSVNRIFNRYGVDTPWKKKFKDRKSNSNMSSTTNYSKKMNSLKKEDEELKNSNPRLWEAKHAMEIAANQPPIKKFSRQEIEAEYSDKDIEHLFTPSDEEEYKEMLKNNSYLLVGAK